MTRVKHIYRRSIGCKTDRCCLGVTYGRTLHLFAEIQGNIRECAPKIGLTCLDSQFQSNIEKAKEECRDSVGLTKKVIKLLLVALCLTFCSGKTQIHEKVGPDDFKVMKPAPIFRHCHYTVQNESQILSNCRTDHLTWSLGYFYDSIKINSYSRHAWGICHTCQAWRLTPNVTKRDNERSTNCI